MQAAQRVMGDRRGAKSGRRPDVRRARLGSRRSPCALSRAAAAKEQRLRIIGAITRQEVFSFAG